MKHENLVPMKKKIIYIFYLSSLDPVINQEKVV